MAAKYRPTGFIGWFANNRVAANLIMAFIVFAGVMTVLNLRQEVFPEVDLDMIRVSVAYPGASPEEVEEAICVRIEEKVAAVEGIKTIRSTAAEGVGSVLLELERGADPKKALDDIQAEVDRITTFPEEAEEPLVTALTNRQQVINLVVHGDVDERTLKVLAERARDDLTELPGISQVSLSGVRDYQISVEVSEESLRRMNLTFDQVSAAVRASSLDLPGGSVESKDAGEILIRTKTQRYTGEEYGRVVVLTRPDGTRVRLDQIARIVDGFDEDAEAVTRFDGEPAAMVQVFRVAEQDAVAVSDEVKAYVQEKGPSLPAGVKMSVWDDKTNILKARRDLLLKNGRMGLILVFLSLLLFLDFRVSFWVAWGIPFSFLGALALIPFAGVTINMLSLFAFIIVLGIVVDDGIVVSENIYSHWERGRSAMAAAVEGAREVALPVVFSVLTTVAAFAPLLFVEGTMGKFMRVVPIVVIAVLLFSLVEVFVTLPAHLAGRGGRHHSQTGERGSWLERVRRSFGKGLRWWIDVPYARSLDFAVRWRYLTLAAFTATLVFSLGWVASGQVKFVFFPKVESDNVRAQLTMPLGTSLEQTLAMARRIEREARAMADELEREAGRPIVSHLFAMAGGQSRTSGPVEFSTGGAHLAEVNLQLIPSEERAVTANQVAARWRERVGIVAGAEALNFVSDLFASGNPIAVQLRGDSFDDLTRAAERLKGQLGGYQGVFDIEDSFREGKMELRLALRPEARPMGLTEADLARQVRQGYYGDEALRIQRGKDEVKVMVRYPENERRSLGDVERMRIRTAAGGEVPFDRVARADLVRGYSTISRQDRKRVVDVTADVDEKSANASEITSDVTRNFLPALVADYPGMSFGFEGHEKNRQESLASLKRGFLVALFLIYALLAVPFRAYVQPMLVMTAIPFGILGAVWGHVLMGLPLTILSMFGIVALSGVVVNDSLIMVDYINRAREGGAPLHVAVMASGRQRFRPILLTTLTTFLGLAPLLLERSMQARFLIPMAVSLAFGIVAATAITLILIPSLYTILEDLMKLVGYESDRWGDGGEGDEEGADEKIPVAGTPHGGGMG